MIISTAYLRERALSYDALRFSSPAGLAVGEAEMALFRNALCEVVPGGRALEVGCGTGRFLLAAVDSGLHCEGVDPSPDMLDLVRDKLGTRVAAVKLQLAEGIHLPYADGSFDFAYCIRVLNQTESSAYALAMVRELLRVVRPGGLALVEFVNYWRPQRHARDVRLRPTEVIAAATMAGGVPRWMRGVFALGMTAYWRAPQAMLPTVVWLDAALSRAAPRMCARCYALFQKL